MTNEEGMTNPEVLIAAAPTGDAIFPHSRFGLLSFDFAALRSGPFDIRPSSFSFEFGGWLRELPPAAGWTLLALASLAGFALVVFSYRHTLRELSPGQRRVLAALRIALLLVVLFILANPSRVERPQGEQPKSGRELAVLIDRSASMNEADNRNETRLGNALRTWKRHAGEATQSFDRITHHRFGTRLEDAADLSDAAQGGAPAAEETHLWPALRQALDASPAGVVCLTDGLDTTGAGSAEVVAEAQRRGISLHFVAATNRSRAAELLSIRDVKTPSRVLRHSKFNVSAVLEISTPRERETAVELWSGEKKLAAGVVTARAGWNVLPWSVEIESGEVGPMPLEIRFGEGAAQQIAGSTTQVVARTKLAVLHYQGALQWGYRFLLSALQTDPSFEFTGILNPGLGVRFATGADGPRDLPDDAAKLKPFQIVVLAHALPDQLSARQQQTLIDYAKAGGGVLFVAPDSEATGRFAGTLLEQMLPVTFARHAPASAPGEDAAERFRDRMRAAFDSEASEDDANRGDRQQDVPDLVPFEVPKGAPPFLKAGQAVPKFANYAKTRGVKPGAEVLAVHPNVRGADGRPAVLLARQRFGAGFTAVLATDLLWRWKMSLPSESRAVETFWQQLLLSLAPATGEGLRLVKAQSAAVAGRSAEVLVFGAAGDVPPEVTAIAPSGQRARLTPVTANDGLRATFTPDETGRWQLSVRDAAGSTARMTLPVTEEMRTAERSNAPADIEGLRRVAEATGGGLIAEGPVFRPSPPVRAEAGQFGPELIEPLWNHSWLLGLLLCLYSIELIARRVFRLL